MQLNFAAAHKHNVKIIAYDVGQVEVVRLSTAVVVIIILLHMVSLLYYC